MWFLSVMWVLMYHIALGTRTTQCIYDVISIIICLKSHYSTISGRGITKYSISSSLHFKLIFRSCWLSLQKRCCQQNVLLLLLFKTVIYFTYKLNINSCTILTEKILYEHRKILFKFYKLITICYASTENINNSNTMLPKLTNCTRQWKLKLPFHQYSLLPAQFTISNYELLLPTAPIMCW